MMMMIVIMILIMMMVLFRICHIQQKSSWFDGIGCFDGEKIKVISVATLGVGAMFQCARLKKKIN